MNRRPFIFFLTASSILLLLLAGNSCSLFILDSTLEPDEYRPKNLVIVAEEAIFPTIEDELIIYQNDLAADGTESSILLWEGGADAEELKFLLHDYSDTADAAFLIGKLPAALYEQKAFGVYEVFPTDLYYMDSDSVWTDSDGNGWFESHSKLQINLIVSRITGTAEEIEYYLKKLHRYRSMEGPVYDGAFLFKDDDWHHSYRGNDFGLKTIYGNVSIYQDDDNTTKSAYQQKMTSNGTEYTYQWIHAYPSILFVDVDNNYEIIRTEDIESGNYKSNFYNLFDCQAARFTVKNIAANYLNKTDSTIAVIGSTKTGGIYYPIEFHKALAVGGCWGAAFKAWFNISGHTDDRWFLGMVIMGDPAIRPYHAEGADLSKGSRSISTIIPLSEEEKTKMYIQLSNFSPGEDLLQ